MNAPTIIQNNVSNIYFPYSIGCCGCTGAGLPPNPVTTAADPLADVPNPELLPKFVDAVAGDPKLLEFPKPVVDVAPNPADPFDCVLNPPLLIPPC